MSILYSGGDVFSVVILFGWEGVVWGIFMGFVPLFLGRYFGRFSGYFYGGKVEISITAYSL